MDMVERVMEDVIKTCLLWYYSWFRPCYNYASLDGVYFGWIKRLAI